MRQMVQVVPVQKVSCMEESAAPPALRAGMSLVMPSARFTW
jgi:hypothetical protein